MQPTGLHSACLGLVAPSWPICFHQHTTRLCTSACLARLAASQESADVLAQPCFSLYIVRPLSRVRASNDSSAMRLVIAPTSVSPTFFSRSAQGPSITSYTLCVVHPRMIFARASSELVTFFLAAFLLTHSRSFFLFFFKAYKHPSISKLVALLSVGYFFYSLTYM